MTLAEQLEVIGKAHLPFIGDKDWENDIRLAIVFSGIPGSGKSTISREIQKRYNGLLIRSDTVRDLIRDKLCINDPQSVKEILAAYLETYLPQQLLNLPNTLLIFDSSIDRTYQKKFAYLEQANYDRFIIALDTPLALVKQRLMKRESSESYPDYLALLENAEKDKQSFRKEYVPDSVLNDSNTKNIVKIFSALDKKIAQLQQKH